MKSIKTLAYILMTIILISGCRSNTTEFDGGNPGDIPSEIRKTDLNAPPPPAVAEQDMMEESLAQTTGDLVAVSTITRKIIKDGRMEIRVKELEEGKREIDSMVIRYKGYYSDETFNNQDYSHGYALKIRIPSASFEPFVADIEGGSGEVAFKNISSRDVTEEFIDLETRLKNKRNYLNRYADLLKQAKSVKDILEIEEKTRLIEEEVESVQGRLKYLNNQVDFSTLDLQISKKNDYNRYPSSKGKFIDRLKMSLVKGWHGLVSFTLFVIRIWPFWIIVGVLVYVVRRIWKRKKK